MRCELSDPGGELRDLNLRRAGVRLSAAELLHLRPVGVDAAVPGPVIAEAHTSISEESIPHAGFGRENSESIGSAADA